MISRPKTWRLLPHDADAIGRLALALAVPGVVAQLLLNRGISSVEEGRRFLDAPLMGLRPPDSLPGVPAAVDRLLAAVQAGKRITIYGDYDVDGITGTTILLLGLQLIGATVDIYLPHRLDEGYGLHVEALRQIAGQGTAVVVTVDCGIASLAEADEAKRLGLELIVTDHHEMKATLPNAAAIVHPRLPGSDYPFGHLSGSAVAFKLAWALAQRHCGGEKVPARFKEYLLDCVALASLGIVADVVPLHDENRILVRHGLARLRLAPGLGLKALVAGAGILPGAEIRAGDVGFRIAPRMNAAGRLGCARLVVDLLATNQPEQAAQLARVLEDQNVKRQTLERRLLGDARAQIVATGRGDHAALVLAGEDWHPGVIGIVASRLADLFGRPTLMISLSNGRSAALGDNAGDLVVGSGRSVPGLALHEALHACGDLLDRHGGHRAAAGFRIRRDRIDPFRERFCRYVADQFQGVPPPPELLLDAETPLNAMTVPLVQHLDRLEPYGMENRRPLFLAGGLQVVGEPRKVGKGERHVSFRVGQKGTELKAIAFGMADRVEELLSAAGACCLAFTPKINIWQGRKSVDLEVVDLQAGPQARLA